MVCPACLGPPSKSKQRAVHLISPDERSTNVKFFFASKNYSKGYLNERRNCHLRGSLSSFLLDDLEPRKRRSFNDRVHKLISALTCAHREELHKKTKAKNSEHSTFFSKGVFSDRSGLLRENLLQRNMLYVSRILPQSRRHQSCAQELQDVVTAQGDPARHVEVCKLAPRRGIGRIRCGCNPLIPYSGTSG